ncbi:hypothetical protein COO60DRAFT_1642347 [Scenedesmus sp. NREL 46B-D3]|nr:hypothetical protein COO60DRAFT_1642347 [Scenedesmus sp. NREL 46B-D3]
MRVVNISVSGQPNDCTVDLLWPSEVFNCTMTRVLTQDDFEAGLTTLQATSVDSFALGPKPVLDNDPSDTATVVLLNRIARLDLQLTADKASVMQSGDVVIYTVVITNTGTLLAQNITVEMPTVSVLNCTRSGTDTPFTGDDVLQLDEAITCIGAFTYSQDDLEADDKLMIVTATTKTANGTYSFDSNTHAVAPVNTPAMSIAILLDRCVAPTKALTANGNLTCPILFTNNGNTRLAGVSLQDHAAECFSALMSPGETYTCSVALRSTRAMFEAATFPLSFAGVAAPRGRTATLAAPAVDTGSVALVQDRRLLVSSAVTPSLVNFTGTIATYVYTITNPGNVMANTLTITADTLADIEAGNKALTAAVSADALTAPATEDELTVAVPNNPRLTRPQLQINTTSSANFVTWPNDIILYEVQQLLTNAAYMAQQDAATVAGLFDNQCKNVWNKSIAACSSTVTAIKSSKAGNTGKRGGLVCQLLGECRDVANFEPTCSLSSIGVNTVPAGNFSLCTMQGVDAGGIVPGGLVASLDANLTAGTCQATADCRNADLQCGAAPPTERCVCNSSTGQDQCELLGACQLTPCARCRNCFVVARTFAAGQQAQTNPTAVAAAFRTFCVSQGRSLEDCSGFAMDIEASHQGNLGKRPALICQKMGQCTADLSTTDCTLIPADNATNATPVTAAHLTLCSSNGVSAAALVPGVSASNASVPADRCTESAPCSQATGVFGCSYISPEVQCKCDPATGLDACVALGQCVEESCSGERST